MFGKVTILFFFFILVSEFCITSCAITIDGVQCGQRKCKLGDYCLIHDGICKSCSSICTQEHHNFEEKECNDNCQDYLHNIRYMSKNGSVGNSGDMENLKGEVQRLSNMITTTLVLLCIMMLTLFIVLCFQCYRWKVKKNITLANLKSIFFKKHQKTADVESPSTNKKPDLRLDITNMSSVSDHSPNTAMTSVSTRRPAEDSALDYAYDNPAMISTSR